MDNQTVAPPGTVDLSTTLDPHTVKIESGGGRPNLSEPAAGSSIEDVLGAELSRLKANDAEGEKAGKDSAEKDENSDAKVSGGKESEDKAKADDKAKDEDKDKAPRARTEQGKFAKSQDEAPPEGEGDKAVPEKAQDGQAAQEKGRQSEGRQFAEPPARFLPKAREVWANVPNAVKADFHRITQEHEAESQQFRASHERYTQIKDYDDLARSNGRDLRESLARLNEVENTLARDPIAGLDAVLREIGPRMANGQPMSLYDVANYVVQNGPEAYQQRSQQAHQQHVQGQTQEELQTLRQQLQDMQVQQAAAPIIQSFINDGHDRYHELEEDIAFFLQSGKIPASLSPEGKLAAAYDMAERINPRSSVAPAVENLPPPERRTEQPVDLAGQKSIRGAPSNGFDPKTDDADTDIVTILRKEMRRLAS